MRSDNSLPVAMVRLLSGAAHVVPSRFRTARSLSWPLFDLTFWTDLASPSIISAKPINICAATLLELQDPLTDGRTPTELQPAVLDTHGDSKSIDELLPRFSHGMFAPQRTTA